jgi:hypothetical protein
MLAKIEVDNTHMRALPSIFFSFFESLLKTVFDACTSYKYKWLQGSSWNG